MKTTTTPRRDLLKQLGWWTTAATLLEAQSALGGEHGSGGHHDHGPDVSKSMGVLVDLSECVGCRLCEHACKSANGIDPGTMASYDDQSVFKIKRRPAPEEFTVINAWAREAEHAGPVYTKVNCVHCNYPSCVSACIVGALEKQPDGAVTYDAWKCIGCRYCMVACPLQLPAYSYGDPLTPQVRKCQLCHTRTIHGELPACVEACPRQAMTYGKREDLLIQAREKINKSPGRYVDHIYGEHEIGGTAWMYLSPVPFEKAGFLTLGEEAPPALTEAIQHGVFKHWIAPIGWYAFLAMSMFLTRPRQRKNIHEEHEEHEEYKEGHTGAEPVKRRLLTPGVWILILLVLNGVAFGLYRFIRGLAATTNLDQQHPWGLWIAMDVGSGIALAGGGFVTAAVVHIFHREHYHAIARSALLTALLGYTFYVPGLLADLGRWYNLWHPILPNMWQGNSVLFEVGLCVMIYLNVQYAELAPIVCGRLEGVVRWQGVLGLLRLAHHWLEKVMPALLVLGVALSTFHQSSLGNLMVIAPYKLHHLWWSPMSPLLFLLSAIMVGFPMVIFTMLFASWSLRRRPEMEVLSPMTRYVRSFMAVYLSVKVGDVVVRGMGGSLVDGSMVGILWLVEVLGGVVVPLVLLGFEKVRSNSKKLAGTCLAVILGVVLNRLNVFVLAYRPPYATKTYFPSVTEFAVSIGLVAALMLAYRVAATFLPILPKQTGDVEVVKTEAVAPVEEESLA